MRRWFDLVIWHEAASFADPQPEKIVVRLGIIDRGRVLDRFWMRGNFACENCTTGLRSTAWHGKIIGFTVFAKTHRLLSFSLHSG